ncbi:MAG: transposase [Treponema sp.]|jgi:transposase-like protein|nr:transposase [Treponema sp.]
MKRYSEEEKEMWVEDWHGSGKSLSAYAKASGLNFQTLKKWTEALEAERDFVEISSPIQEKPEFIPEILIEKGDIKIHLPLAITRNDLRAVIQSLGCEL